MNSKLSYQAINRKSHKTLNTLFGIPVTITHNYSYTYPNIAFLDGGSMKSLIKISLFSKLCSTFSSNDIPVLRKTNIVLKSISGDKLLVHGKTTLILIINNTPFICDFIVVEDSCCTYPKDILIGCDILTKILLLLDYSAQIAYLKDKGELKPLPLLSMANTHFKSSENISQIQKTLSQKQKQKFNKPDYISIDIDPISESKSQTTESSDYFSNAKLQSLQNELHDLKTRIEDFISQTNNTSSESRQQNINNSSFHENFYDTNTNSTFNLKNSVLDIGTDSVNLDIHKILTTASPLQITENHTNFNDFSSVNAVNLDTHPIFTTASPIQITENHANFNDFSSVNATTSYSSDLSDEQICKNFKDNTFKSSLKSYSSPNVEHSNKRVQFQLNEKESNTKVNTNLNTSNLFPRKDNQISLGDSNQCLKQHFRTSSQAFSRKENTTKQNSKFQSSQNSYHPQILPDSYSYPKTFHNRSLQPQTLQNSSHSQTYSYPKTFQNSSPQPQTFQNSSHSQTYSYPKTSVNSHPYSSQTFSHFQNSPHSPTSVNPLSHSSQTIPHSQTSPNFLSHSPQTSSPHILQNITPHNSPLRHNNSPSNSSPSPMMKDNRQTDPSYKPHPLYKNSQNISQMRLRSHTKQTQNVQNISPRKLRSHFK
ncbi:UNVERIFIED_CONTAM: hypothetical protein RMT77_005097 [Armadillidium vulgare]